MHGINVNIILKCTTTFILVIIHVYSNVLTVAASLHVTVA